METQIESGDAAYSIYENSVIQAQSRAGYWQSGGRVNPGTSTNEITVEVETGEVSIADSSATWATQELTLEPGGVGPNGTDQNEPRVDVISAASGGSLDVTTGVPAAYAPDTKINDQGTEVSFTPGPFEHWSPSPNDGTAVAGVVLALVLIEPNDAVAADLTTDDINNFKVGVEGSSAYIRGDGTPTGSVTINVDNNDFTITDDPDIPSQAWFDRDASAGTLTIGAGDAQPTLGEDIAGNGKAIRRISTLTFKDGSFSAIDYNSLGGDNTFKLRNTAPSGTDTPIEVGSTEIQHRYTTRMHGKQLINPSFINWKTTEGGSPEQRLWAVDTGGSNPTTYYARSDLQNQTTPSIFELYNADTLNKKFFVRPDGVGHLDDGDSAGGRIATREWANSQFTDQKYIDIQSNPADPPAPASGLIRIYESEGRIEAKDTNNNIALLGQF